MFGSLITIAVQHSRAVAWGLALSALILALMLINSWREDSAQLDMVREQIKAHNADQGKADEISKKGEKQRIVYRDVVREIDASMPVVGCVFDDASVMRTQRRIDAGESARLYHDTLPPDSATKGR